MRLFIAPDKFKGSLAALDAARRIASGFRSVFPDAECLIRPIADGGEGTAELIRAALDGRRVDCPSKDALGRPVPCRYAWIDRPADAGPLAVIEMSEASGFWRIEPDRRNPLASSTFGTGLLIADAVRRGAKSVVVGLGGSATNDGGAGMAAALGYRFLDATGIELFPFPEALQTVARIEPPPSLPLPPILIASDVRNPLLGPRGASRVYGPQKGASPAMVGQLESALQHLADLVARDLGCDPREREGAGAAGGLGYGLMAFCGASVRPGFDFIAEICGFEADIARSDLVLTGEGRLDAQTLEGKGPAGIAAIAKRLGKPVIAFAGGTSDDPAINARFDAVEALPPRPISIEESVATAGPLLEAAAARAARLIRIGAAGTGRG
jgi:glycerate kinase